jgi:hypothetical protein
MYPWRCITVVGVGLHSLSYVFAADPLLRLPPTSDNAVYLSFVQFDTRGGNLERPIAYVFLAFGKGNFGDRERQATFIFLALVRGSSDVSWRRSDKSNRI